MNRDDFEEWRKATSRAKKAGLLAKMAHDNEALVQRFAGAFIQRTKYATESIREDIFQAARIGLLTAISEWDPDAGAFSTIAFFKMRHEMQLVLRHATPISRPKDADLPRAKQDAMAAFYAKHGRDPEPEEVGITPSALKRAQAAQATFMGISTVNQQRPKFHRWASTCPPAALAVAADAPEDAIDRARDLKALRTFVRKLSAKDREEFWTGKRDDLTKAATAYVERRRVIR